MILLKNFKKGQALPLNTIVIATLVIIVLLVIIVFFTTSVTESNETIGGVTKCNQENPILSRLGYTYVKPQEVGKTCDIQQAGSKNAIGVANCCVLKDTSSSTVPQ